AVNSQGKPVTTPFHPYSEVVYPWIQAQVKDADDKRFDGENLLFSANQAGEWAQAEKQLKAAEKAYNDAAQRAAVVRDAAKTRDDMLSVLPYYSHWLARWRLTPDKRFRDVESEMLNGLLDTAEKCWEATHDLEKLLAAGPSGAKVDDLE